MIKWYDVIVVDVYVSIGSSVIHVVTCVRLLEHEIYSSKKVLHHLLLFLCILNFQYLWNLEKWRDQAQIFREWC